MCWLGVTRTRRPTRWTLRSFERCCRSMLKHACPWPQAGQNVLVGGDMNAPPDSLDIALFRSLLPSLRDPWAELHPEDPGHTSNSPNNTLAAGSSAPFPACVLWYRTRALRGVIVKLDTVVRELRESSMFCSVAAAKWLLP